MKNAPFPEAEVELEIPFHDVDMLKIVWHGHYCKYFETARCALLEKIGYDYLTMKETGYVWPIVDLRIRYARPGRFRQRIRVRAELVESEYRMKIRYRAVDAETGETLAKGHTVQVAVDVRTGELCYASPEVFLRKLAGVSAGSP
jgi:acyl-CoA thioester hydrolase